VDRVVDASLVRKLALKLVLMFDGCRLFRVLVPGWG
jgi:hypothetical protein